MKKVKPLTTQESHMQKRFAHPHDVFVNKDEGMRIARRRWKRNRSKLLRRNGKREASEG